MAPIDVLLLWLIAMAVKDRWMTAIGGDALLGELASRYDDVVKTRCTSLNGYFKGKMRWRRLLREVYKRVETMCAKDREELTLRRTEKLTTEIAIYLCS